MHALPSKALGCAQGWPHGLRSDVHQVRPNLDGELSKRRRTQARRRPFLLPTVQRTRRLRADGRNPGRIAMTKPVLKPVTPIAETDAVASRTMPRRPRMRNCARVSTSPRLGSNSLRVGGCERAAWGD